MLLLLLVIMLCCYAAPICCSNVRALAMQTGKLFTSRCVSLCFLHCVFLVAATKHTAAEADTRRGAIERFHVERKHEATVYTREYCERCTERNTDGRDVCVARSTVGRLITKAYGRVSSTQAHTFATTTEPEPELQPEPDQPPPV